MMRRASSSLLSRLSLSKNPSRPHPPSLLKSCKRLPHALLLHSPKSLLHLQNPSTLHLSTLSQNSSPSLSSRQLKIKERDALEEALESASSTADILAAFASLEPAFSPDDPKLGLACLKVGQFLDAEAADPEKALSFADRALKILYRGESATTNPLPLAMALHLMGSVNYSLKRFNDSLGFLNRANRSLGQIGETGSGDFDVRPVIHAVQLQLANTKTAMGRREEALVDLRKCMELKETLLEPNSKELGIAYRELAEAYIAVLNFKEALPFCLKALDVHRSQLGGNSVEVAHDRRVLGVIYSGLEEHDKALEQNEMSQRVLKNWGMGSDLLQAEIEAANIKIALGKYDEAIGTLKGVVQQTDKESEIRALVFIAMAKALCNQEKFADSKRCLEISCGILDKREIEAPVKVAEAYAEISMLYETMNEFETAISLLKRALSILEKIPQEQHAEGSTSARIGWLLLLTGKVPQAIPYLESAAERLKESFGPKHFGVGYIYNNLGAAYMELDRPQSAAQMFAMAKDIMDVCLGPHHADSIESCQNLASAYGAMGSFGLAMEFQQRVIDAWENHGPTARDDCREAHRLLEQLKKKAQGASSELPRKALPLPHASGAVPTKSVPAAVEVWAYSCMTICKPIRRRAHWDTDCVIDCVILTHDQKTFSISVSIGEMSFRKMDDKKHPRGFVPETDLQGIQPLPSDFDKWKRYKVEDDRRGYYSKRGRRSAGMV